MNGAKLSKPEKQRCKGESPGVGTWKLEQNSNSHHTGIPVPRPRDMASLVLLMLRRLQPLRGALKLAMLLKHDSRSRARNQFELEKTMNQDFSSDASAKFGTFSGKTFLQKQQEAAAYQQAQRQHELKLACLNGGQSLSQCGLRP